MNKQLSPSVQPEPLSPTEAALPAKPERRTQAMRSSDTQRKLCEAAVALLVEVGYGGLTTAEVAKRAGVSKGAQTHHFPTKEDMLVAAFRHLLSEWADSRSRYEPEMAEGADPGQLILALWDNLFGRPDYLALVEVLLAARHEPRMRDRMREAMTDWMSIRNDTFARLLPLTDPVELADFLTLNFSVMRGLAIYQDLSPDKAMPQRVLTLWSEMTNLFLAQRTARRKCP